MDVAGQGVMKSEQGIEQLHNKKLRCTDTASPTTTGHVQPRGAPPQSTESRDLTAGSSLVNSLSSAQLRYRIVVHRAALKAECHREIF